MLSALGSLDPAGARRFWRSAPGAWLSSSAFGSSSLGFSSTFWSSLGSSAAFGSSSLSVFHRSVPHRSDPHRSVPHRSIPHRSVPLRFAAPHRLRLLIACGSSSLVAPHRSASRISRLSSSSHNAWSLSSSPRLALLLVPPFSPCPASPGTLRLDYLRLEFRAPPLSRYRHLVNSLTIM